MIRTSSWPRGWMTDRWTFRPRRTARSRPPSGRRPRRERASACPRGGPRCPNSSFSPVPPRPSRSPSARSHVHAPATGTSADLVPTASRPWSRDPGVAQGDVGCRLAAGRCRGSSRSRGSRAVARTSSSVRRRQRQCRGPHDPGRGHPACLVTRNSMIAWAASEGIRYANADGTGGALAPIKEQPTATRTGRRRHALRVRQSSRRRRRAAQPARRWRRPDPADEQRRRRLRPSWSPIANRTRSCRRAAVPGHLDDGPGRHGADPAHRRRGQ